MTRLRLLRFVATALALILVAGCNDDAVDDAANTDTTATETDTTTSTSTTETTSTTPTTRADDYSIPAVIDAAYVDHVLKALNRVDGDALRLAVAQKQITMEVTDRILAINTKDWANVPLADYSDLQVNGFAEVEASPGDNVMTTKQLVVAREACLLVLATADYNPTAAASGPTVDVYIVLENADPALDPGDFNPTPWAFDFLFSPESLGDVPEDQRCGG